MVSTVHRFGRCELRVAQRQLCVDGEPVAVGARAFDVLLALIERAPRVVGKNELMDAVWPGLVVEEGNIAVHIAALRKLIGSAAIATIPGRGYQFTAALADADVAPPRPSVSSPGAATDPAPLYGREADLHAACALVDKHQLVTIAGAPGIGKTRLAKAVARRLAQRYADGVWMVELAALSDAALLPATLAAAMGLATPQERPSASDVALAMAGMDALVVIDNCEHLLCAVASLVETIAAQAPSVRVLATSQEPLRSGAEQLLRLSPLPVPPPVAPEQALQYAAVELFCARARADDSGFALTPANCQAVIDICRRLDGIPLAIELATARLRLLGIEGLRERLDDVFKLLTRGRPHALPRHQTLRAALEWSHALLSPPEQAVLRRLGVFAGRFGLQAAQQVIADGDIDDWAALDHLGALVDKSLVAVVDGPTPHYRLLETTRMFALEQLSAAGEATSTRRRHAQATLAVLEQIDRRVWTLGADELHARLEPGLDNLRAALTWAAGPDGDRHLGLALAAKSSWLWDTLNLGAEGVAYLLAFERWATDPAPLALQAAYWQARMFHFAAFGAAQDLGAVAERAIALARRLDSRELLYDALVRSTIVAARTGRIHLARQWVAEARKLEQPSWPPRWRATRFFAEAEYLEAADQLQQAKEAQRQRIELLRQAGEHAVELHAQGQLVQLETACGEVDAAIERGRRALAGAMPHPSFRARVLQISLARALLAKGMVDEATTLLRSAMPMLKGCVSPWHAMDLLADLWAKKGDFARAARLLAWTDRMHELRGIWRRPNLLRARDRLAADLAQSLPAAEHARLRAEGEALSEDEALSLAVSS